MEFQNFFSKIIHPVRKNQEVVHFNINIMENFQ